MNATELAGIKKREQIRSMVESMKLSDLMSKRFEYVSPEDQLSDVLKRMGQLDLHEMPVRLDGKRLMGVVSYGTLLKR
jgi:Mg/Co/Ni transporter MgtE